MEKLICGASAMTYCFCIPRDMNHPIPNNFNNNTFYVMVTYTFLKLSFLGYKPLGYRFHSIWKHLSAMDRWWITDATQVAKHYMEISANKYHTIVSSIFLWIWPYWSSRHWLYSSLPNCIFHLMSPTKSYMFMQNSRKSFESENYSWRQKIHRPAACQKCLLRAHTG